MCFLALKFSRKTTIKFQKCFCETELKPSAAPNKSFLSIPFLGHPVVGKKAQK